MSSLGLMKDRDRLAGSPSLDEASIALGREARGAFDPDSKHVKLGFFGGPTDFLAHGVAEAFSRVEVLNVRRTSMSLELTIGRQTVRHGAVDGAAGIAEQIQSLERPPHHSEKKPPFVEIGLDRADTRRPVFTNRSEEKHAGLFESFLGESGKLRSGLSELIPSHRPTLARLFIPQGVHGARTSGASCRNVARDKRHGAQDERDTQIGR